MKSHSNSHGHSTAPSPKQKSNTLAAQKQWLLPHNRRLGDVLETNTNDAACQRACAVCVCHNMYNQFIPNFTLVPLDNCIN